MKFKVVSSMRNMGSAEKDIIFLVEDGWNDWFIFNTMYNLIYVDKDGTKTDIGSVKIGQLGLQKGRPPIEKEFEDIGDSFFSIGQSDEYYIKINELNSQYMLNFRDDLLGSLNDMAFNTDLLLNTQSERVTEISLFRDVSLNMVRGQFSRLTKGGARLTPYNFKYESKDNLDTNLLTMYFEVKPDSIIPSNIHVIIGRNGVGKTHLIKSMISSLLSLDQTNDFGKFTFDNSNECIAFANIVYVSFSAFDNICKWYSEQDFDKSIPFEYVGLQKNESEKDGELAEVKMIQLDDEFFESLTDICRRNKSNLWIEAIISLSTDPIFAESDIQGLIKGKKVNKDKAKRTFNRLSSGHKIILLTITKIVEKVEEKSLIFLDEPEGHLHPPLLSSFIRTLSKLLTHRNGVSIIATHSPVVLQEVPSDCVWKLHRFGKNAHAERLEVETFGQSIGVLTREVFRLETTRSGFYNVLKLAVKESDNFNEVIDYFEGQLGSDAAAMIPALLQSKYDKVGDDLDD